MIGTVFLETPENVLSRDYMRYVNMGARIWASGNCLQTTCKIVILGRYKIYHLKK